MTGGSREGRGGVSPTGAGERAGASGAPPRPSVILVREWEMQMSSSGCCGRLEGDFLQMADGRCFPERRRTMEQMGPLYRDLRERWGDAIAVSVVDPRNMVTMLGLLVRDVRDHRPSLREILRTLFGMSVTCVVVNGRLVARGAWPSVQEVERVFEAGAHRPVRTAETASGR